MADRILTVGIETDLSGLDTRTAMDRFAALGQSAQRAGRTVFSAIDSLVSTSGARLAALSSAYDNAGRRVDQAAGRFVDASGRMREANGRFVGGLGGSNGTIGTLGKLTLGYFSASKALDLFKQGLGVISDIERVNAGLRAVSKSNEDYAATQSFLQSQSDRLGFSYEALASSYKGLKASTNDTNLEGEATEKIFMSVVRAGASLKLSNDDVKGSLLALQQMMSKGTVQAEELRGQLAERIPNAFGLAAKAMGATTAQLNKMLESGEVMASDLLPKLAVELEKAYGSGAQANINSMAGGWTRATDNLKLFLAEFAQTNGIDRFFAKLGNGIANYELGLREANKRGEGIFMLSGDRRKELTAQAKLRQEYIGLKPEERKEMLAGMQLSASDTRYKINNPEKFGINEAVVNANRRLLADQQERITILKREELKLAYAEGQEARKTASVKVAAATFDIDKAKARQMVLAKQIQNYVGNDQSVPVALQREYDKLTARIDKANDATKKHKERLRSGTNEHTYLDSAKEGAQQLEELIGNMLNSGQTIPDQLLRMLSVYRSQLKETKRGLSDLVPVSLKDLKPASISYNGQPLQRPTQLFNSGIPAVDSLAQAGQYIQDYNARNTQINTSLSGRKAEMKNFGSLDYFETQLDKIRLKVQNLSLKNLSPSDDDMYDIQYFTKKLEEAEDILVQAQSPIDYIGRRISQLQRDMGELSLGESLGIPQEAIDKLAKYIGELRKVQQGQDVDMGRAHVQDIKSNPKPYDIGAVGKNWAETALENLARNRQQIIATAKDMAQSVQGILSSAAPSAAEAMGDFVNGLIAGTSRINDLPGIILGVFADMLQQLATALATSAAFMAFVPGLQGQALAQGAAAIGLFGVSGVARAASSQKKQKAFAGGNTAFGKVQAVFGEYPNAARDPEFTAPVSIGANLIGDRLMQMGFGGGGDGNLRLELKGSTLLLWFERAQKESRMKGGGRG